MSTQDSPTPALPDPFAKPVAEKPEVQVDTPINLRPDLAMYGIEEVDRGICEDTYENRSALRRAKLNWIPVYAVNGVPTGTIQALSPEMQTQQRLNSLTEKEAILVDPESKNSDYLTGFDLLAEEAADNIVPPWVLGATKVWAKWENGSDLEKSKKKEPYLPKRCSAIKDDGIRCQLWTGGRPQDDGMCRVHLGSLRNKSTDSVERARARLTQAAPAAVDVLEHLIEHGESEPVKLKAATEILDRAGVRAGFDIGGEVTVDIRPAASIIAERLARLSQGAENILAINAAANGGTPETDDNVIEAELVEHEAETVTINEEK